MYEVAVLMSCYNGEKYIAQQIESILNQDNVNINIYIRDDGSTDNTRNIIKKFSKSVFLLEGDNVGLNNSFASLIWDSNIKADFYAFSDQDDVWQSNKLITAINYLVNVEGAGMYASNQRVVDENLKYIKPLYGLEENDLPFPKYKNFSYFLIHNNYFGNTIVFNNEAMRVIREYRPYELIVQHDTWVSIIIYMFGTIIFDRNMYSSYRQHDNNVVGGVAPQSSFRSKMNTLLSKKPIYGQLATFIMTGYKMKMTADELKFLTTLSELPKASSKIKLLLDKNVTDRTMYKTLVLYILIIFSKF
ncbi:glycosyltransferase [Enterococcus sp.]|uniref:glycosyltransferase n=1 Tax=Enterococcus sp. TaxID=35783 RepID=UPI00289B85DE|nr:glycosyltransferase [Enterococcus sp.]